jgi:hypothetical protein
MSGMSTFNYYGRNGCCLTCGDRICNNGIWCDACLCKDCRWYEHIQEVEHGCCFHPHRKENPQFDGVLKELGLIPISNRARTVSGILREIKKKGDITGQ